MSCKQIPTNTSGNLRLTSESPVAALHSGPSTKSISLHRNFVTARVARPDDWSYMGSGPVPIYLARGVTHGTVASTDTNFRFDRHGVLDVRSAQRHKTEHAEFLP